MDDTQGHLHVSECDVARRKTSCCHWLIGDGRFDFARKKENPGFWQLIKACRYERYTAIWVQVSTPLDYVLFRGGF